MSSVKHITIQLKKSPGTNDLPAPAYMSQGSAGMDLFADVDKDVRLEPGQIKLIPTGISLSLPQGYEAQIRPRSGLALKHGITLVNTPGTIDSDYRGVVSLILTNLGGEPYVIKRGSRLAQMVIQEVVRAEFTVVDELEATARSTGGFGHTGV